MVKKIVPWEFQTKAVKRALAAMRKGQRALIVSPGGSGKTVMVGLLVLAAARARKRVLLISHRREILMQTYEHLVLMGVPEKEIGLIYGEARPDLVRPHARIQLASVQTLILRKHLPPADVVIVDECHRVMAPAYLRLVSHYKNAAHVGLTATPFRLDGVGLGNYYERMFIAATPPELIKAKRLAEPVIYSAMEHMQPNLESVRIARGDYLTSDLEPRVMKTEIIGGLPEHWAAHAKGLRSMTFGLTIAHSKAINDRYLASGIRSGHVDGDMSRRARDAVILRFKTGQLDMLCSCEILIEGFDLPDCDAVSHARPTMSLCIVLQQAARALRYNRGRTPVLLDHARLFPVFGLPYAERPYTLTTGPMSSRIRNPGAIRICQNNECSRIFRAEDDMCPGCGEQYVEPLGSHGGGGGGGGGRRGLPDEVEGSLSPYADADKAAVRKRLEAYAKENNLSKQWVDEVIAIYVGFRECAA